jgi:hypothetical protein
MKELKYGHESHHYSEVKYCCVGLSASIKRCSTLDSTVFAKYIVARRSVAGQRPQTKQLFNSRCYVTASQTSMFSWKQLHSNNRTVFSVLFVPRYYKQDSQ